MLSNASVRLALAGCCATLLCWSVCAQTKLVVSAGGPYTTIQDAVDAAQPGDLIEVRGGGSHAGASCSKGVQIYGRTRFDLASNLEITNLPSDQHVGLANFRGMRSNGAGCSVRILSCKGSVHLRAIETYGSSSGHALHVSGSAQVTATDCSFYSNAISVWGRLTELGGPVEITSSNVSMRRCSAIGRLYSWWNGRATTYRTYAGISATSSRIVMVDCSVAGGAGYCTPFGPWGCLPVGPMAGAEGYGGSQISAKRVTATGGSSTTPGMRADATSRIILDAATSVTVGGTVVTQDLYDLDATGVAPGRAVPVTLRGKGVVPFAVFANHPALPVQGPPIDIWLDLNRPVLLYADALNGTRRTLVLTPSHLPLGLTVCLQAVVQTQGGLESSTPAVISLR